MTKFTITFQNNSDARNFAHTLGRVPSCSVSCKHNGGKKVVAVVAPETSAEVEYLLENNDAVASFEMVDA